MSEHLDDRRIPDRGPVLHAQRHDFPTLARVPVSDSLSVDPPGTAGRLFIDGGPVVRVCAPSIGEDSPQGADLGPCADSRRYAPVFVERDPVFRGGDDLDWRNECGHFGWCVHHLANKLEARSA